MCTEKLHKASRTHEVDLGDSLGFCSKELSINFGWVQDDEQDKELQISEGCCTVEGKGISASRKEW